MANKAAVMTPTQISEAGYAVSKSADIGNADHAKRPWILQRRDTKGTGSVRVLDRYATYNEAVEALHVELTDPDGTLR